ncbi:MAG: head-tail connector protein [Parvularcula sp.]|jgi:uncharacterized phiE125 gp8 family phage protein|nr:head-tail connector protein [Parvularcula sp.]
MMLELITPPTVEPFTLTNLKEALRIDHSQEDDLVMKLGIMARRFVERRLGRAVAEQTWRMTAPPPAPGQMLQLRPGPVTAVDLVEAAYGEADFKPATGTHRLVPGLPSHIALDLTQSDEEGALGAVRITFRAGLTDMAKVDEDLVLAILQLTAHYYEHREAVSSGRYVSMPLSVETMLAGLREVRL